MFSPLFFYFISFHYSLTLWVKIWAWRQVTWFMFLVHWWASYLTFVPVFPLLGIVAKPWMAVEKIKKLSQNGTLQT